MSRNLLPILLILTLVLGHGLQLHGHLDSSSLGSVLEHGHGHDHDSLRIHSHLTDSLTATVDHADAVELDIVGATVTPYHPDGFSPLAALIAWALVLSALWVCITHLPAPPALIHFGPPRFLHPTLRAPPA